MPISGLFDLEPLLHTSVNDAVRMTPDSARRFSPAARVRATGIPALVAVGGAETPAFREQSQCFERLWSRAGNAAQYLEAPGRTHFTVLEDLADPSAPLFRAAWRMIAALPVTKG